MKKLYTLLILLVVAMSSIARDRTGNIPLGLTMLSPSMTMTAADSINESDTVTFTIVNLQKYMQLQVFTVTLDNISGTTDVTITAYGKVTSTSAYVQIGSPVTLSADGTATITATSPINYNYLKVELIAGAGAQHSLITSFIVKTSNAYDVPANSGTLTVSRATEGTVTIQTADNNANAAAVYRAGGTGALTLGASTGTTAITSSDWAIGTTGIATGLGNITSDGAVIAASYNWVTPAQLTGTGDSLIVVNAAIPALAAGLKLSFIAEAANTTTAFLTLNGVVKDIYEQVAAAPNALEANDIRSGAVIEVVYDGTQWVMVSPSGN